MTINVKYMQNIDSNTDNNYYAGEIYWNFRNNCTDSQKSDKELEQEEIVYKKLKKFIENNDLNGLITSQEFIIFGVNYRFGYSKITFLHHAYRRNKPEIVKFLIKNGADERISNDVGLIPIEIADDNYQDSLHRVINEVVQRYFKELHDPTSNNPHVLFDVIQNFIHEKKWKYIDTEGSRKIFPFRDGQLLSSLGVPELAYHVNCADLTNLFVKAAHKIGMEAQKVKYIEYNSILAHEKEKNGIIGKMTMFDGSANLPIKFYIHYVAYSSGWHFDLTLMCKYQERDAVLSAS